MKKIEVCYLKPEEFKNKFGNPRKISKQSMQKLKDSISMFDDFGVIVIDELNNVISGNQRVDAIKELNIETPILCKKMIGYSEKELKAINIKSNEHSGEWEFELLNEWLEEIKDIADDFNVIDEIDKKEKEDDIPEVKETTVKKGDLYKLGRHYLLCGDSTKKESYKFLLKDKKADMVFTDPPYGVDYSAKNEMLNSFDKGNLIQTTIINDDISKEELETKLIEVFTNIKNNLNEYNSIFIFCAFSGEMMIMMLNAMNKGGMPFKHMIIWKKNNHVLGLCDYNYKHEPILMTWVGKHKFYGKGDQKTSVWEYNKPTKNDLHPTMKPVALIENAILNNSKDVDIIIDSFLGSGSTLIACEKTNRTCYGIEISEHYCQVIIDRYKKYTGKEDVELIGNIND